ncbi:disintegrin and metalloproteinase domain-containing protein 10-like [Dendronephthya gigantea]|uniref:disintegrin and metalloproteinase domain-containing protein 10-like n=1 Tax=Dendronephthya gigantea TaxID=151771 RepID=UPI00106AC8FC|nr:disintegrin and metalloproteinase domain-containing protein 10-like [Dendronephthya gigantea]
MAVLLLGYVYYLLLFTKEETSAITPLNDFVRHFETLNYAAKPKLYRRDTQRSLGKTQFLVFNAHGRKFQLMLWPDTKALAPDAEILDGDGKKIEFDRDSLLTGEVVGEPGSIVHGVLHQDTGLFTGKILMKDDVYFIESAKRYFNKPMGFHSVIYKDEDVKYSVKFAEPKIAPIEEGFKRNDLQGEREDFNIRTRRATGIPKNNFCRLSMEADYTFLGFATDAILAVGEILKHVQAVNIIYGQTFNTSSTYFPYSLQFHVGLLQVHNKDQTPTELRRENIDSSTFLSIMSKKDYSSFCQAVYFTHRDFAGGILGLAWIGYPQGRAGGMCDGRRGSNSYNTAVVTFTLQGRNTPPKVSEITFAHEIGHAFGAKHDEDDDCVPGGEDGNYIMFDKATSGDRTRNDRFSQCSIEEIMANVNAKRGKVIDSNVKKYPRLCLESYSRMVGRGDACGNGVIEGDEECDCGMEEQCRYQEPNLCCDWRTCKLNIGKTCSPSQGPCCNKECKTAYEEKICGRGSDCLKESRCPSLSERTAKSITGYKCPSQEFRPVDTECEGGALLCHKGLCSKSICTKYNLKPCECKKRKEECHACCIENGVCRSAYKIDKMKRSTPYNYSIGTPCANNTGYCDFFQYCQRVDLEGPLLQLFNLYFTSEGVRELTRKYWWAILLGTLGLVGIIVLLVVYGARYTGTDNPDGKPAEPLPSFCCCGTDRSDGPAARRELRGAHSELKEDKEL